MELRTCSKARPAANMAKVLVNTFLPQVDRPAATVVMLASAMPMLKKRSGYLSANFLLMVEPDRSASSTTNWG
jgi:hypothetical protein